MANKQFLVVAYDISNDKRRTRLHDRLEGFGVAVQYSVFECLLEAGEIKQLKAMLRKTIRPRLDHVRIYYLCGACYDKIVVIGRKEVLHAEPVIIVGGESEKTSKKGG